MGNKYFSNEREWVARNIAEETISPPADLTIDGNNVDWKEQIANHFEQFNGDENSVIIVREAGIFSNFADGLVFKNANESIDLFINARFVATWTSIGNVTLTQGSKTMTGAGFNANLSPGDFILVAGGASNYYAIVDSVTDDNNAELRDYAQASYGPIVGFVASSSTLSSFQFRNIRVLNRMYSTEWYVNPILIAGDVQDIILSVQPNYANNLHHDDVVFHTDSISTDYDEAAVYFDGILKVEITEQI